MIRSARFVSATWGRPYLVKCHRLTKSLKVWPAPSAENLMKLSLEMASL